MKKYHDIVSTEIASRSSYEWDQEGNSSEAETSNIDDGRSRAGQASVEWAVTEPPRVQNGRRTRRHCECAARAVSVGDSSRAAHGSTLGGDRSAVVADDDGHIAQFEDADPMRALLFRSMLQRGEQFLAIHAGLRLSRSHATHCSPPLLESVPCPGGTCSARAWMQ